MFQPVGRRVGRRQHFNVKALEQTARAELRSLKAGSNLIVDVLRRLCGQALCHAEHVAQLMREPSAGRRAAEEIEMISEELPDAPMVALDFATVTARDAELFER